MEQLGTILAAVFFLGLMVWAVVTLATADMEQKEKFMVSCQQDHKEYECTVMWRAGENRTTVMPVPVYVGR